MPAESLGPDEALLFVVVKALLDLEPGSVFSSNFVFLLSSLSAPGAFLHFGL